jgi:SpoVK/Ycf46/Vps4 family AAA+-type ATPase
MPTNAKLPFLIELANPDIDLESFISQVLARGLQRFSLCLYGPPGTGKSAFIRYLAEKMRMPVLQKRVSDLQSMWVGETEKNIAMAFREAVREKKFLVFDEADSFLHDRRQANRAWELTAVNEMLTWMESHPLPFACTTNLMERLDQASLRRFTFKVKLGYLTPTQVKMAFKYFFGIDQNLALETLTPADFELASNKADILDLRSTRDICELLKKEVEAKGEKIYKVGF